MWTTVLKIQLKQLKESKVQRQYASKINSEYDAIKRGILDEIRGKEYKKFKKPLVTDGSTNFIGIEVTEKLNKSQRPDSVQTAYDRNPEKTTLWSRTENRISYTLK